MRWNWRCIVPAQTDEVCVSPVSGGEQKKTVKSPKPTHFPWWLPFRLPFCTSTANTAAPYSVDAPLVDSAWVLFLAACLGCSLVPVETHWISLLICAILFGFISLTLPDRQMSPWPYGVIVLLPLVFVKSTQRGGIFSSLAVPLLSTFVPLADLLSGVDIKNPTPQDEQEGWRNPMFAWRVYLVPPCLLLLLVYVAHILPRISVEIVGIGLGGGFVMGIVGIVTGHELCHRTTRREKLMGRFIFSLISYGHFYVEHTKGHHKNVGTPLDPVTPYYGVPFWSFLPRAVFGEIKSSWRIETERLQRHALPWWQNTLVQDYTLTLTLALSLAVYSTRPFFFLFFFACQSSTAICLFQLVNYVEHYGLERAEILPGVYEPVGPSHSWESPARLTNYLFLRLQRHADHHAHANRPYYLLRWTPTAPQLPAGYAVMTVIALCPPLWRYIIHPRLDLYRRCRLPPRAFRYGPSPQVPVTSTRSEL